MADIVRILKEYNMNEHTNSSVENGIVISKGEWKEIVNDKVKNKENKEWKATSLLGYFKISAVIYCKIILNVRYY